MPALRNDTKLPATVQIVGELKALKVTGLPDVPPVALRAAEPPATTGDVGVKPIMVWGISVPAPYTSSNRTVESE